MQYSVGEDGVPIQIYPDLIDHVDYLHAQCCANAQDPEHHKFCTMED